MAVWGRGAAYGGARVRVALTTGALAGLLFGLGGCASTWGIRPAVEAPPVAAADSLATGTGVDEGFRRQLLTARWHLLRALDERSRDQFEAAQSDLDEAFHLIASLSDSPFVEADADGGDAPLEGDAAASPAPGASSRGDGPRQDLDRLAAAVEEAYLSIVPHLATFTPDSPLSLLLQGLSDERLEDLPEDASQLVRIHQLAPQCGVPIDANARVAASIHFFQTRGRNTYLTWMRRAGQYRDLILPILRDENVPEDFFYLAMIESGFNPRAYSRARASGLWQFISHTARLEGLRIDYFVDERRDPVRSTRAAARHLKALYANLGDWRLAAAAYNCGPGRVSRAIKRAGTRDFWELGLPTETRNYVPLFMAAVVISRDPALFGFPKLEVDPPVQYEEARLSHYVGLKTAARAMGTTVTRLQQLNPELRRALTPPKSRSYRLHVPPGKAATLVRALARLPAPERTDVYEYRVQRGDNISSIADAFGVSSQLIADANSLTNANFIREGQTLYVPASEGVRVTRSVGRTSSGTSYKVRPGDSLSTIARRYGVTVAQLQSWNDLRGDLIRPGQTLRVSDVVRAPRRAPTLTTAADGRRLHKVGRGESLWSIARQFEVTIDDLRVWNGLRGTTIYPGQELVVGLSDYRLYTVVQGDTLYSIARRFGLSARDIARQNNISLSTTLLTGMQLRIKPQRTE